MDEKSQRYEFDAPFDLKKTFECGQIFRYHASDNFSTVYVPLRMRIIKLTQVSPKILQVTSNNGKKLTEIMDEFLRVDDKYEEMLDSISIDPMMTSIVKSCKGLRLLKQDVFECSFSFILSQCSNIPRITQNLQTIAQLRGKKIEYDSLQFDLFPTRDELIGLTEEDFRDMGFGYRAKYLDRFVNDCPSFLKNSSFCVDSPEKSMELNKKINKIYGIGNKVADCIQLFGVGDLSLFPVDTWMKKFMLKYYCKNQKVSEKKIRIKGQEMFGNWAGYAQQFIFHHARNHEIFEKKKKRKSKTDNRKQEDRSQHLKKE